MNPTLIAGLKATARHVAEAGQALTTASESIDALVAALEREMGAGASGTADVPLYKKPNGRLSEAGVAKVWASLGMGMSDKEIAADLEVHHTAIIRHRKSWQAANPDNIFA